jgi:hypothetical protein
VLDIAKFGKGLKFPERPGLLWHGCVFRQWLVFFVQDFFHLHRFKTCCRFGDIGSGQPVSKYLQVLASPPSHVQNKMCNASVEPRRRPALRRLTITYIVEIVAAPGRRTTEPRGSLTQSLSTLPRSFHHLMAVKKSYPKEISGQIPIAYANRAFFQMFRLAANVRPYWNFILSRLQLGPQSGLPNKGMPNLTKWNRTIYR